MLADIDAWSEALAVVRMALIEEPGIRQPALLVEWLRRLPSELRSDPVCVLLEGTALRGSDLQRAAALHKAAAVAFLDAGDVEAAAGCIEGMGAIAVLVHELSLVLAMNEVGERLKALDHPAGEVVLAALAGGIHLAMGDARAALNRMTPAAAVASRVGMVGMLSVLLARAHLELGRGESAEAALDHAGSLTREFRLAVVNVRSRAAWMRGDRDETMRWVAMGIDSASESGHHNDLAVYRCGEAYYEAMAGNVESARRSLATCDSLAGAAPVLLEAAVVVADAVIEVTATGRVRPETRERLVAVSPHLVPPEWMALPYVSCPEHRSAHD
ncbi:MAG: hypothetical protein R2705_20555, partial [Ilumatobacteraceae bacterium]